MALHLDYCFCYYFLWKETNLLAEISISIFVSRNIQNESITSSFARKKGSFHMINEFMTYNIATNLKGFPLSKLGAI